MNICQRIAQLRYNLNLTQEKFAERIMVSEKTVRRWESNAGIPNAENLITISKEFGVSLDALLNDASQREVEEHYTTIMPNRNCHVWESYEKRLMTEYEQSFDEGLDIEKYHDIFAETAKLPDGNLKKQIGDSLFNLVINLKLRDNYCYNEPFDLEGIRILRKEHTFESKKISDKEYENKVRGAWLGRICGCLLGKPIECIRTNELLPILKETGNYPMHRYISSKDITEEMCNNTVFNLRNRCWADTIKYAPADDDTNYTVIASMVIDKYGKDFTSDDVMDLWLTCQAKDAYCTAERVAWKNYFNGYCPPDSAVYKNPYREYIGAQIRGDYFGYICPGEPEKAAEFAWRDARISHIKNGIYGEMFVSAMLACAAVCDNKIDVIRGGLAEIPSSSRLFMSVSDVIDWYSQGICEEECRKRIHSKYNEHSSYGWCHVISNAMIVTMALLYHDDYGSCICAAVQTGFDTDCNGATVGSIFGMLHGADAIGNEWTSPISNTLKTTIIGVNSCSIDDLVKKTVAHSKL